MRPGWKRGSGYEYFGSLYMQFKIAWNICSILRFDTTLWWQYNIVSFTLFSCKPRISIALEQQYSCLKIALWVFFTQLLPGFHATLHFVGVQCLMVTPRNAARVQQAHNSTRDAQQKEVCLGSRQTLSNLQVHRSCFDTVQTIINQEN